VPSPCLTHMSLQDLKTVFMINCGATDDVRRLCELSDNVRVVIIDSHRPVWHGYNIDEVRGSASKAACFKSAVCVCDKVRGVLHLV